MSLKRTLALVLCTTAVVAVPSSADETKLIMHVIPRDQPVHCYLPEQLGYRDPATETVTAIDADTVVDIFLYLADYDVAMGAGFQLVWPMDWAYLGWSHNCMASQISLMEFADNTLQVGTVFNRMTGGGLVPLGYLSVGSRDSGEVHLVDTRMMCRVTRGICYVTEDEHGDVVEVSIGTGMIGRVAVGDGGYNPAAPLPVDTTTWGGIKSQYIRSP